MNIGGEFAKAVVRGADKPRVIGEYWASDLGKNCMRQHWYNFNTPEAKEPLLGNTKFKFLYGNILEEAALYFTKEGGYDVSKEQERVGVELFGADGDVIQVTGRIDAFINGKIVDVKSTSSYGFKKVQDKGTTRDDDSFGYLWQLGFYQHYADWDSEGCGFLWIDKQNGTIAYEDVTAEIPTVKEVVARAQTIHDTVSAKEVPDYRPKECAPKPYGKSGNMCLPVKCSYCPFKKKCWSEANGGKGLRGFAMSQGPVWMTEVKREPRVPEIPMEDV